MALAVELALGRDRFVVYDLHLESQCEDDLRLWQLSEVVGDSRRYPASTPIVIAGDLNTRNSPSPLKKYLETSGFRDAYPGRPLSTKPNGTTLDWIFTRGPASCVETTVYPYVRASDHYPVSTNLKLS